MRAPNGKADFTVDVEGIGTFTFGRRTQKDKYLIRSLYSKITNNYWIVDDEGGSSVGDMEAWMHANIEVLAVAMPDGFSLEKLDPIQQDDTAKVIEKIFLALRAKEVSFRPQPQTGSTGDS